jgi:formate C-acetyltransferase
MPAFNNDEIVIPEFIKLGVEVEDAYNYSAIGVLYAKEIPLSDNRGGDELVGRAFINNLLV